MTINPVLDVPEYPMPTAGELFMQLNSDGKFTKLYLYLPRTGKCCWMKNSDGTSRLIRILDSSYVRACLLKWPQVPIFFSRPRIQS